MAKIDDRDTGYDDLWPELEAECQACDLWGPVNDIGLCDDCNEKFDRDMVRNRDWAYSALAFGCPQDQLENLRNEVIARYGEKNELIAENQPGNRGSNGNGRGPTHA